jgi:hypothetical protein
MDKGAEVSSSRVVKVVSSVSAVTVSWQFLPGQELKAGRAVVRPQGMSLFSGKTEFLYIDKALRKSSR